MMCIFKHPHKPRKDKCTDCKPFKTPLQWNYALCSDTGIKSSSVPNLCCLQYQWYDMNTFLNSLTPGKFEWNLRYVIFKRILVIDGWGISCEIAPIWMSLDSTDDQSTLVQVMAWCRQATSHYLSQCWPRSLSPYSVTRPQWVNSFSPCNAYIHL